MEGTRDAALLKEGEITITHTIPTVIANKHKDSGFATVGTVPDPIPKVHYHITFGILTLVTGAEVVRLEMVDRAGAALHCV